MNSIRAEFIIGTDDEELGEYTLYILPRVGEYVSLPYGERQDGLDRYKVLEVTHFIFAEDLGNHNVMIKVGHVLPSLEDIEVIVAEYREGNA